MQVQSSAHTRSPIAAVANVRSRNKPSTSVSPTLAVPSPTGSTIVDVGNAHGPRC